MATVSHEAYLTEESEIADVSRLELLKPGRDPCPQVQCPNNFRIPPRCRRLGFITGSDGVTRCPTCYTNICGPQSPGPQSRVCPQIQCPGGFIPNRCRRENYVTGSDGITRCRVCPSNRCQS